MVLETPKLKYSLLTFDSEKIKLENFRIEK